MDRRIRQTATASPAEPGDLPMMLAADGVTLCGFDNEWRAVFNLRKPDQRYGKKPKPLPAIKAEPSTAVGGRGRSRTMV